MGDSTLELPKGKSKLPNCRIDDRLVVYKSERDMKTVPLPPRGTESFLRQHTLWWVPDRFFLFRQNNRTPKDYSRPAWSLGLFGPQIGLLPLSRMEQDSSFKAFLARSKWTVRLPGGQYPGLEEESLVLVGMRQLANAHEVVFALPTFIGVAQEEHAQVVVRKLEEYIDAQLG